jgi:hypothetical protein
VSSPRTRVREDGFQNVNKEGASEMHKKTNKITLWEAFEEDTRPNAVLFDDAGFLRRLASVPVAPFPSVLYLRRGLPEQAALTWDQIPDELKPLGFGSWRAFRETWRAFVNTGTYSSDYGMIYREQLISAQALRGACN